MEGGCGHDPRDVANWTLDQIFSQLTDRKRLRRREGGPRTLPTAPENAAGLTGADGKVAGRDGEGRPLRARVGGMSKVQMIRKQMAEDGIKE